MAAPVEADKEKYLKWVADLKTASEESKTLEPEKTSTVPADQKKVFLENYQNKMEEMIEQINELAKAIGASKWEEAKILVSQINQIQREGHQKYRTENEGH